MPSFNRKYRMFGATSFFMTPYLDLSVCFIPTPCPVIHTLLYSLVAEKLWKIYRDVGNCLFKRVRNCIKSRRVQNLLDFNKIFVHSETVQFVEWSLLVNAPQTFVTSKCPDQAKSEQGVNTRYHRSTSPYSDDHTARATLMTLSAPTRGVRHCMARRQQRRLWRR